MLLGHSDIRITLNIYTHITKKNQDDAIDALKKLDLQIKKHFVSQKVLLNTINIDILQLFALTTEIERFEPSRQP